MSAFISTWPRRLSVALSTLLLAAIAMFVLSIKAGDVSMEDLSVGDWMKRLLLAPSLVALLAFLVMSASAHTSARADTAQPQRDASTTEGSAVRPFIAQVVGLEWLNPLQRRDYPTEWQVLWTMGLVGPNKNDDMVRTKPEKFAKLRSIGALVYGNRGEETFKGFYGKYVNKLLDTLGDSYVMRSKYFYTVAPDNPKNWRELAGIHIEFAVPERLDPLEAQAYLRKEVVNVFNIGHKEFTKLWTRDTPPEVIITPGGANAGFASLNNALDYLQANPDKTVWVMNWDAPSFPPKDAQINENMVLLFLAGPGFDTERAPLAWIGKAATANVQDFEKTVGTTRKVQAWKAAIASAAHNANISSADIDYTIHDAGVGSDAASVRLGSLAQTLTETLPEFDYKNQTFNTPGLLGEMGTGTALTNVVLAIGRANHLGQKVLVAGTSQEDLPMVVVVTPPSEVVPIDPDSDWFRARGANNAYLPWWGRRFDTKYGLQGASF